MRSALGRESAAPEARPGTARAGRSAEPAAPGARRNRVGPAPNRNGGRHCCQPPLRRAKDLPVFVTWPRGGPFSILAHQLRRRLPSNCSLLRGARPIYSNGNPEDHRSFGRLACRAWPEDAKTVRCSAALLGVTSTASRFALHDPKTAGAASRDRKKPLPAPLTDWPRSAPERTSTLPAGGDRTFGHLPRPPAVAGNLGRLGPPSRSPQSPCTSDPSRKSENMGRSLWITGISGTTVGTFPSRAASSCRSVPPALLRPSA